MTEPTYLAKLNKHERDDHVTFDEGPHIYNIDGDESFMSVTTWNHSHFAKFDADKIIENMMRSKKWPQSKYFGQTPTGLNREVVNISSPRLDQVRHWFRICPVSSLSQIRQL